MKARQKEEQTLIRAILFGFIACLLYGVGAGLRSDLGILLNPLAQYTGLQYEDVSMCIAVMQLVFGAAQPLFGMMAARTSNRLVLIMGSLLLGSGMIGMVFSGSFLALLFSLGILFGLGAGALAFGLILTSAIHFAGRENAMILSGMLNAAAGMVGFVLSPVLAALLGSRGTSFTLTALSGVCVLLIPIVFVVTSHDKGEPPEPAAENRQRVEPRGMRSIRDAFGNRTFRLLLAGFSTCGFHMVIIESHLFSQFVLSGLEEQKASWAFSVYGIATIAGALLSGFLCTRFPKGKLLGFYYGFRAVWVLLYLWVFPKTLFTAVLFAVGLGLTGDATVSPTSGLVSDTFALNQVATLVGVLFFTHQIGAFCSAWLGGALRNLTGNYTLVWCLDIALCLFASIMSLRIRSQSRTMTC